jgi:hypothetical protein
MNVKLSNTSNMYINKSDSGVYNWCDHVDSGVYACCDQSNSVFSYCNQSDSAYTIVVITKN